MNEWYYDISKLLNNNLAEERYIRKYIKIFYFNY